MNRKVIRCVLLSTVMIILILDTATVIQGAKDGVELCLNTVIASLFPFIFISSMLTSSVMQINTTFLKPIGRITGTPSGAESLLMIGILGGYPIGANSVAMAYSEGAMKRQDAERMLGYCNNAGPAFIFGLATSLFENAWVSWFLWGVQIISCLTTGILLPNHSKNPCQLTRSDNTPALPKAIKAIATVCGWIIIFRTLIAILTKWVLWLLPVEAKILITGILELTNGCINASAITNERVRFILLSVLLSLGGFCVAVQTASVTQGLNNRYYYIGKMLQSVVSLIISIPLSILLFPGNI